MKKKFLLGFVVVFLVLSTSCSSPSIQSQNTTTLETTNVITYQLYPMTFASPKQLVDMSDVILIGEITNSTVKRFDLVEAGYENSKEPMEANVSSFTIRVDKNIKGEFSSGSEIKVDARLGGECNGYYEIYEPELPVPKSGKTYIFFLTMPKIFSGREYFQYMFNGSFDGFYLIEDGQAIPQHQDACMTQMSVQELESEIKLIIE